MIEIAGIDPQSKKLKIRVETNKALLISLFIFLFFGLAGCSTEPLIEPKKFSYRVVGSYPHDPTAFTQGLAWDKGIVYEGTGKRGNSSLRRVDLQTGNIEQQIDYKKTIFAEGITVFQDRIYQLTWKNKSVFMYDKHTFSLLKSWKFPGEGWGITHDNQNLIVSDGTATLYFLDPETLNEKRRISVRDNTGPIESLNELEYIKGTVYANIWKLNRIAIINPKSGIVEGWINLAGLREQMKYDNQPDVLNGIMHDPEGDRLFVTGKLWSTLFEIKIIPGQ